MSNLQPNCCLKVDFQKVTNMQEASGYDQIKLVTLHQIYQMVCVIS